MRKPPRVVAVLGITAWQVAFDRPKAVLGRQPERVGGAETWVAPNPSGLNAHYELPDLARLYRELVDAPALPSGDPEQLVRPHDWPDRRTRAVRASAETRTGPPPAQPVAASCSPDRSVRASEPRRTTSRSPLSSSRQPLPQPLEETTTASSVTR